MTGFRPVEITDAAIDLFGDTLATGPIVAASERGTYRDRLADVVRLPLAHELRALAYDFAEAGQAEASKALEERANQIDGTTWGHEHVDTGGRVR